MEKYVDRGQQDVEDDDVGEQVLLKLTPQIWKISSKTVHQGLIPKYDGPSEVVKKVGKVAYRLAQPDKLKIHPTLHVNKFHENLVDCSRRQVQRAPLVIRQLYSKAKFLIIAPLYKAKRIDGQIIWFSGRVSQ